MINFIKYIYIYIPSLNVLLRPINAIFFVDGILKFSSSTTYPQSLINWRALSKKQRYLPTFLRLNPSPVNLAPESSNGQHGMITNLLVMKWKNNIDNKRNH